MAWDKETMKPYEFRFEPSLGLIEDITIGASGGLWIRGGIPMRRENGQTYEIRNRVVACRCGQSANKPYCDGTHAAIKWRDELNGEPVGETLPEEVNKKSGVLGISGVSSDFRDLGQAAAEGNERAQLALDMFHYQVRKEIGAFAAAMGGVDVITFTAGVGENGIEDRAAIAEGLEYLGVKLDPQRNNVRGKDALISTDDSTVKMYVIPTNEEIMIARDTKDIVSKQ